MIKDGIDEAEAIKLGYYKVDTIWIPVLENLFFNTEVQTNEVIRRYDFEAAKVDVVRTPKDTLVNFVMESAVLDSTTNAFHVYDPYGYNPFTETGKSSNPYSLGNLSDGSTNGSWEQ